MKFFVIIFLVKFGRFINLSYDIINRGVYFGIFCNSSLHYVGLHYIHL